jgi:hypothetical protein
MAAVPFLLTLTGLAADLDEERPARVIAATDSARTCWNVARWPVGLIMLAEVSD